MTQDRLPPKRDRKVDGSFHPGEVRGPGETISPIYRFRGSVRVYNGTCISSLLVSRLATFFNNLQKQNDGSWAYGLLYHLITHFPVQFTNISTIPIPNAHWREKLLKLYFLCKEMITSDSWIEEKLQKIVQSVSLCACCGIGVPSKTQLFQTAIILPDSPNAMATQVNCATCNDPKNVKWNLSETEEGVDIEKLTSLIVKEENQYISLLHIEEEWYKVDDSGNFTKLSTDVLQEHLHNTVLIFYKQPVNPPAQSQLQPPANLIDPPISGNKRFFFEFFKIFL